jgi:multicomponent Na+:H+ antiporter subunit G
MMIQTILAFVFIIGGIFFIFVSSMGLLRLPDFYTRCHAIGKSETLGSMLFLGGLAIYNGWDIESFKLIVILLFIGIANPTATHIVAHVAYLSGLQPWVLKKRRDSQTSGSNKGTLEEDQHIQEKGL